MKKILLGFKIKSFGVMKFLMLRNRTEKSQIFRSIIIPNTIYVMHDFFGSKVSSKLFFHYKTRALNVTMIVFKRVIRRINKNITLVSNFSFKEDMFFAFFKLRRTIPISFFTFIPRRLSLFKFGKRITMFAFLPFRIALLGAKRFSLFRPLRSIKFMIAKFTFFKNSCFLFVRNQAESMTNKFTLFRAKLFSVNQAFLDLNFIPTYQAFFNYHCFSFVKMLVITLIISYFPTLSSRQCEAANEWLKGSGEHCILGTELVSDIDAVSYQNIVAPLDRILANYRENCIVTYVSSTSISVSAGEVMCSNSAATVRKMRQNTTPTVVSCAALNPSTTYYVYAIADADANTFTIETSTSTTPSGTCYRRLATFYMNASTTVTKLRNYDGISFGDSVTKSGGVIYQAATDGIVTANLTGVSAGLGDLIGVSDSVSTPTTVLAKELLVTNASEMVSITFPVTAGNYYEVYTSGNGAITATFTPLQSN
jgi:hypothetical protein